MRGVPMSCPSCASDLVSAVPYWRFEWIDQDHEAPEEERIAKESLACRLSEPETSSSNLFLSI